MSQPTKVNEKFQLCSNHPSVCCMCCTEFQDQIKNLLEKNKRLVERINERMEQHQENLRDWKSGYLNPTEPDEEERARIKRGLEACIYELEQLKALAENEK